jgi:hypothetical protein
MLVRPRDLADRMSRPQRTEIFTLPIESARLKAREILDQFPQADTRPSLKTGGSFPTVRLSSRCDIYRLRTDGHHFGHLTPPLKKIRPRFPEARSYTARGVHSAVLPSWFISSW